MKVSIKDKSGISVIIAVVLMILFLSVGAAVITSATATSAGAAEMMNDRKCYYFAVSIEQAVKSGITKGSLGDPVLSAAADDFADRKALPYSYECDIAQTGMPEVFKDEDGNLNADIVFNVNDYSAEGGIAASKDITAVITARYETRSYTITAKYKYNEGSISGESNGWTFEKLL